MSCDIPMDEVGADFALYTFVNILDNVISKVDIQIGKQFVSDIKRGEPASLAVVLDFIEETMDLLSDMASKTNYHDMKTVFNEAKPESQKIVLLRLALFMEMLQSVDLDNRVLFPKEPFDMMRYFLIGDWIESKQLIIVPE